MFDQTTFNNALATKYSILGQQANAATSNAIAANRQAGAAETNAGSDALLRQHQGGLLDQQSRLTGAQATEVPADSAAHRSLMGAEGRNYDAQSAPINSDDSGYHAGTAAVPNRPATDQELMQLHQHLLHAANGANQVPGSVNPQTVGTQASDQVPAMLAPREAVLNEHGADIIGRDKIAAANAIGNHMATQQRAGAAPANTGASGAQKTAPAHKPPGKGMPAPKKPAGPKHFAEGTTYAGEEDDDAATQMAIRQNRYSVAGGPAPQNFAAGTHEVAHGKSAKTPTKIDPAAALALLQMAGGGGKGMPAPMQGGMPSPAAQGGMPQGPMGGV